jgi:hypothetical protein
MANTTGDTLLFFSKIKFEYAPSKSLQCGVLINQSLSSIPSARIFHQILSEETKMTQIPPLLKKKLDFVDPRRGHVFSDPLWPRFVLFLTKDIIIFLEIGKKCKISNNGLPDLQLALCGIKMNSEVFEVCQKNNLLPTVKLRPLN